MPILACAVCPACLTTYAKVLSVVGIGFGLSETSHMILLACALTVATGMSAWRSLRTRRLWPLAVALTGSALVVLGHLIGEVLWLEWTGVLILLIGGLTEHFRLRRLAAAPRLMQA